ncbi:protein phosphatase [Actinomyces denticolens]|uniref:Protein phosphatase n=1 Tax=Actinomyces denticolens TaxID=52767 RepID=A0ABY1IAE0_9ACTO|nr:PP2C family serine/threonine-protein phosphatase [Actinomyces denticolens]SHI86749.1 protein phosphatase [Actinomyces denticolens]
MTISLRYAARSDIGLVRQSNQDSAYAGPHLCVLCDGMGGPAGGDIASAVAIEHLAPLDADSHQAGELLSLLRSAVQDAHAELIDRSASDPELSGLGTTCVGLMRSGNKLAMVHVGDSRAYLLRDGEFTQVTTDHTFVEYLVESGRLTREQARRHPQRSVLLRVLGDAEGDVQLDESIREAVPGDRWLLCSDGLCGPVTAETIGEVLTSIPEPEMAADQLIDLALRAGGPDNVTVVIVDIVDDDEAPQSDTQVVGSAANRRALAAAARAKSAGTPADAGPGEDGEEAEEADSAASPATGSADTPAAKAAALVAGLDPDAGKEASRSERELVAEEAAKQAERAETQRRRGRRSLVASLILLVALAAALGLGYMWTQRQYYVTTTSANGQEQIAIYQGIPQSVGPIRLSHVVETYDAPPVDSLTAEMRSRLASTVAKGSIDEARAYVSQTVTVATVAPTTPVPSSSATPSVPSTPSAPPTPTPSATAQG